MWPGSCGWPVFRWVGRCGGNRRSGVFFFFFFSCFSCKAQCTVKGRKYIWHKMCTVKKTDLTKYLQLFPLHLSRPPCAPLNSITEDSSTGRKAERDLGFGEKWETKGEDDEGKDFNIWFPHLKYINLSSTGAPSVWVKRKKGELGEEKSKGTMTFSLWNLLSFVSVVNTLPKDSKCHHDHSCSKLLSGYRWHYILCLQVDNLIPVRLQCFVPQIC